MVINTQPIPNSCFGIIPARYRSQRFPGKPLTPLFGKPMIWHVYIQAIQCTQLEKVVVATDDERILNALEELDIPAVMTRTDHPSGTDRVFEASRLLKLPPDAVVVNIQGDEPALDADMLKQLVMPFEESKVQVTTLACRISYHEAQRADQVKVVFDKGYQALYFSRAPIPHHRDGRNIDYYGHIGLYAFRFYTLERFASLQPSPLEQIEKLEQLRMLENGIPIRVVVTDHKSIGVDRPEDIKSVNKIMSQKRQVSYQKALSS